MARLTVAGTKHNGPTDSALASRKSLAISASPGPLWGGHGQDSSLGSWSQDSLTRLALSSPPHCDSSFEFPPSPSPSSPPTRTWLSPSRHSRMHPCLQQEGPGLGNVLYTLWHGQRWSVPAAAQGGMFCRVSLYFNTLLFALFVSPACSSPPLAHPLRSRLELTRGKKTRTHERRFPRKRAQKHNNNGTLPLFDPRLGVTSSGLVLRGEQRGRVCERGSVCVHGRTEREGGGPRGHGETKKETASRVAKEMKQDNEGFPGLSEGGEMEREGESERGPATVGQEACRLQRVDDVVVSPFFAFPSPCPSYMYADGGQREPVD